MMKPPRSDTSGYLQSLEQSGFLGRYKLLGRASGTSVVYLAEQMETRLRCAIKILPGTWDEARFTKILIESQLLANLEHPNLVRILDVDYDGRLQYLVTEYVQGNDLKAFVAAFGPMPAVKAAQAIAQAADCLTCVHQHGLFQRDIRPAHLTWWESGAVQVLAIGLEWSALWLRIDDNDPDLYEHLAPEIALDSSLIDARSDVYSLGSTLYFLLTALTPFESAMAQVPRHASAEPSWKLAAPKDLIAICRKMMARKPADRYQTAGEVRDALSGWLQNAPD